MLNSFIQNIRYKLSKIKQIKQENVALKKLLRESNDKNNKAFADGNENTWSLIKVCLYDMYKNDKLLDFGSMVNEMASSLQSYNDDWNMRDKKMNKIKNRTS